MTVGLGLGLGCTLGVGVGGGVGLGTGVGVGDGDAPGVGGLDKFCGSLGVTRMKSLRLSLVSWVLPLSPPGLRS